MKEELIKVLEECRKTISEIGTDLDARTTLPPEWQELRDALSKAHVCLFRTLTLLKNSPPAG